MSLNAGNRLYSENAKVTAEDNTQTRFELFLLGDGERKVSEEADTRKLSFLSSSESTDSATSTQRSLPKNELHHPLRTPISVPFRPQLATLRHTRKAISFYANT